MSDVFVEREWDPPVTDAGMALRARAAEACREIHRIRWCESLWSLDGSRQFCRFVAPDAESVRIAARDPEAPPTRVWTGTIHDAAGVDEADLASANVAVSRQFPEPRKFDELQQAEDAAAGCLDRHDVHFLRSFFSLDRRRMVCIYRAPDAEALRVTQREAGMPVERIWAFRRMLPQA